MNTAFLMNKKIIITAVLLIATLIVVVFIVTKPDSKKLSENDSKIITSTDGKLKIEIPKIAIPKNLSLEDIKVSRITAREFFGLSENETPSSDVIAYSLKPDGMEFLSPIRVTIEAQVQDFSFDTFVVPIFLHAYGDADGNFVLDMANNTEVNFLTEQGVAQVTGEIMHFSNVGVDSEHGLFHGEFSPDGGDYFIGDSFTFSAVITDNTTTYMTGNSTRWVNDAVEVTVSVGAGTVSKFNRSGDKWIRAYSEHLTPYEAERPLETVVARQEYRFEQEYTCVSEGNESLAFVGGTTIHFTKHFDVPRRSEYQGPSFFREEARTSFSFDSSPRYECLEEVEFEYIGGQTIEIGPDGEFIDRGYLQQGQPPTSP